MDSQRFNHQTFSEKFTWGRTCVTSVCVVQPVSVSFETLIGMAVGTKREQHRGVLLGLASWLMLKIMEEL